MRIRHGGGRKVRCFKTRAQRALRAHTVSFYTHVWSAVHIAKARSSKYWEKPGRLLRNGEGVHLRRRGATDTDCAASAPKSNSVHGLKRAPPHYRPASPGDPWACATPADDWSQVATGSDSCCHRHDEVLTGARRKSPTPPRAPRGVLRERGREKSSVAVLDL